MTKREKAQGHSSRFDVDESTRNLVTYLLESKTMTEATVSMILSESGWTEKEIAWFISGIKSAS